MLSLLHLVKNIQVRHSSVIWKENIHKACLRYSNDCQLIQKQIWKVFPFRSYYQSNISSVLRRFGLFIYKKCDNYEFLTKLSGIGSTSIVTFVLILQKTPKVSCEAKERDKSRLIGLSQSIKKQQEAEFDWNRFLELLKPECFCLILAIISAIVVAVYNVQIPVLLGDVVNVVSRFITIMSEESHMGDFFQQIKEPALKLLYIYLLQSIFTFVYISTLSYSGERLACNMRKALFSSILKQDIVFFDSHKTGEIISRLTSDVQDFKSSFKLCISQGLRSLTQASGCIIALYCISPKMTAFMVLVIPSIIGVGAIVGSLLRHMSKVAQAQLACAAGVADEAIGNVRTVRAFAMEDKETELYNAEVMKVQKLNTLLGIGIGGFQAATNFVLNGIVLGVLFAGGCLLTSHEITPGNLMSFLVATQTIQRSLAQISLLFGQYIKGIAAGARVFQYMNLQPECPLKEGDTICIDHFCGDVKFKNVTFSYPTRPYQNVLRDFSLHLPPGKIVAVCGLSGGGKSTIAALMERFYDVSVGSILLDGHDIKTLDPSWLRGQVIGFISQEPVLFATSMMENIRYGHPDATDEEVVIAAKMANADDFICSFPQGYNTVLGERGVTISGGQKQRIAIARALVKNPKILILDEATRAAQHVTTQHFMQVSTYRALDAESEKIVQEALDRVVKGRTVLVIAHRLSTIQNADIIAVLSHGNIAESGTHKSLKKKRGLYWELIRQQHEEQHEVT